MATTRKFAKDDANLNVGAIIVARKQKYIDLDLEFSANTATGDIFKKKDANAVKTAIKHLILTDFYERPFQPFLGTGIKGLLFELADDATSVELQENIKSAIQNYEPRAQNINIIVNSETNTNSLDCTIEFTVVSTSESVVLRLTLDRLR